MMRALFLKELKQNRTSFLVWSLTIVALIFMTMAAMPTMMATGGIKDLLNAYPPEFMRAFSIDPTTFSDPLGFYSVYSTLYVALLGSIFSISMAATILHKEQSLGTAEFLLAKPLSRLQIYWLKLAAYLTFMVALNAIIFLAGWASLAAFSTQPFRMETLIVLSTYAFLLALSMGGVGILVSVLVKRARSLIGPAIGIALGFYFWDTVAKITQKFDAWGWLSPFKWIDLKVTVPGYDFVWWRLMMFGILIVCCFLSSSVIYRRKDIL
jgi:ABC-2 type transport system permease protein